MAVKIAKTAIIRRRIRRDVQTRKRQENPSEHMAMLAGLILVAFLVMNFFEPKKFPQATFNAIRKTDGKGDKDRYLVIYPNMRAALLVSTHPSTSCDARQTTQMNFRGRLDLHQELRDFRGHRHSKIF